MTTVDPILTSAAPKLTADQWITVQLSMQDRIAALRAYARGYADVTPRRIAAEIASAEEILSMVLA